MVYRKDIQILRGIAVLLVVLFHLQIGGVRSGFLGVDIFFVISGFLMAILYNPTLKIEFFTRRSKRLLPTYFMVIVLTLIVSIFITIPNEYDQVSIQSIYATFFSSNIGFWMQNSYFSKEDFNPLLHLWSLGVEIQFYLIVPLLYWIFKKSKFYLPLILFLSLVACFVIVGISPKTSFFMMPVRLWEFLIGYSAAVYFTHNGNIKSSSFRWIGMVAILFLLSIPTFNINGESLGFTHGHPGFFALAVSLSTGTILIFGIPVLIEKSKAGSFLGLLGEYSYSIYLVHFPIIVFMLYDPFSGTILNTDSIALKVVLLAIIIFFSVLMYQLVEIPSRRSKKNIHYLLIFPPLIAILLFLGNLFQQIKYSKEEFAIFNARRDRVEFRCGKMFRILDPAAMSCNLTGIENPKQEILLVGDSHADSIKYSFASIAAQLNMNVYFIVKNSTLGSTLSPKALVAEALSKKVNAIVLHYHRKGIHMKSINDLVDLAERKNIAVALIMPIPIWEENIPKALYDHLIHKKQLPVQSNKDYDNINKDILTGLSKINKNNFQIYKVDDILCSEYCEFVNTYGKPYYFDSQHLTITGSERLEKLFYEIMTNISR